jgi:hypothetical protein
MYCQETTEANTEKTEPDRGMMQSIAEHQVVPKEEAIVKPVKGWKKRRRGRKPAVGRRGEPKELTQSDCGSRKKLATTCRKVFSSATVAWHKKNLFKKIGTQGNCVLRGVCCHRNMDDTLCRSGVAQERHRQNRLHQGQG